MQKTAYELRISDWSSDVCSSDLLPGVYLMALKAAPLMLLAIYAALRHKGHDTQLLAAMLAFQGAGAALSDLAEQIAGLVMVVGFAQLGRASCRERVCQYV